MRWLAVAVALQAFVGAGAQERPVRLDVGYGFGDGDGRFHYRLEYRGATVSQRGRPLEETSIGDAPRPRNVSMRGDELSAVIERDRGSLDGALFDVLGLRDFRVPALRDVRFVGQASGRMGDGQRLSLAFGLESAPFHPLGVGGVANYAMVGVIGESRFRAAAEGGNEDALLGTVRMFAGASAGAVLRAERRDKRDGLLASVSAGTFPFSEWPNLARKHRDPEVRALLSLALADYGGDAARATENLATVVRDYFRPDQPTVALWFEGEGSYRVDRASEARWRETVAGTVTWWPVPAQPEALRLQLRYENGFRRASPLERSVGWTVTLGVAF